MFFYTGVVIILVTTEFGPGNRLTTIRERIIVTHHSAYHRDMVREITLLNKTAESIPSIFLYSTKFMPGLRVIDEAGKEIPYLTNRYTKQLFTKLNQISPHPKGRLL